MQSVDRRLDRLDRIAVWCALVMGIGAYALNPGEHALAGRVAFAVANGVLSYAIGWAVLR